MTLTEAIIEVRRKARYALQPEFVTIVTDEDVQDLTVKYSRTESVKDEYEIATDTVVYDTTSAAIKLLEMVAPVAPSGKSMGGVSVTYEAIENAIRRLKEGQVAVINMGTYYEST